RCPDVSLRRSGYNLLLVSIDLIVIAPALAEPNLRSRRGFVSSAQVSEEPAIVSLRARQFRLYLCGLLLQVKIGHSSYSDTRRNAVARLNVERNQLCSLGRSNDGLLTRQGHQGSVASNRGLPGSKQHADNA